MDIAFGGPTPNGIGLIRQMMVNAAERVFRGGFARPVSHYPPTLAGREYYERRASGPCG